MVYDSGDHSEDAGSFKGEVVEDRTTVHTVEGEKDMIATPNSYWWYIDTASNPHIIGVCSFFVTFTEDVTNMQIVRRGTSSSVTDRRCRYCRRCH